MRFYGFQTVVYGCVLVYRWGSETSVFFFGRGGREAPTLWSSDLAPAFLTLRQQRGSGVEVRLSELEGLGFRALESEGLRVLKLEGERLRG